jgi:hypothetical protein
MNTVENKEETKGALDILHDQTGRIGYLIAWLCGVPASVLIVIFLLRGH